MDGWGLSYGIKVRRGGEGIEDERVMMAGRGWGRVGINS